MKMCARQRGRLPGVVVRVCGTGLSGDRKPTIAEGFATLVGAVLATSSFILTFSHRAGIHVVISHSMFRLRESASGSHLSDHEPLAAHDLVIAASIERILEAKTRQSENDLERSISSGQAQVIRDY
jgi:hypothetical protein